MKSLSLVTLRVILTLLALGWLWQLKNGELIRPFHPINLLTSASLLLAAACIWVPATRIVASAAAIVYSAVFGFQITTLMIAFPSDATFSSNMGPFVFEGASAHIVIWTPLILLVVCGLITICKNKGRQNKSEQDDAYQRPC